ncbi:hypothetical protein GOODEAATRI_010382, partial [Goodea atripinnis]
DGASQKESLKHSPCPRRSRKLLRHLVEYEHDLHDPEESESSLSSGSTESDKEEDKRWEKMEVVWGTVLETMNEMQVTIKETSGTLTKHVEQLERTYKSRSPFLPHSHALQQDRAESLPALLQSPQPNSGGMHSYTTVSLNLLSSAPRQNTKTPVNLLRPVEPAASIFTAPQHVFQPLPEPQPVLQPRVNAGFLSIGQSASWPTLQPAPQPGGPLVYPGTQLAPLPYPPPRVNHVIQPALQPVIQVA